jgi:hypothetical protein
MRETHAGIDWRGMRPASERRACRLLGGSSESSLPLFSVSGEREEERGGEGGIGNGVAALLCCL